MLDCGQFYDALRDCGIRCIAGVPDSLLKSFLSYAHDHDGLGSDRITANEGNAVALAAGHYLATGQPGLVYMQNSGLGNAVNPLTSLADREVYGIPMLLLIGWRGEPGVPDEPQHRKKGSITLPLLEALGIGHEVLPDTTDPAVASLRVGVSVMPGTEVAVIAKQEGLIKDESELVKPTFYIAEEVKDWIVDYLQEQVAQDPRWNLS